MILILVFLGSLKDKCKPKKVFISWQPVIVNISNYTANYKLMKTSDVRPRGGRF